MNILDENILDSQRQRVRHWRMAMRHMGYDVGRQGMKDQEILALLHRLRRPTFFTRDEDFYARHLCHARYCLVYTGSGQGRSGALCTPPAPASGVRYDRETHGDSGAGLAR